MFLQISVGYTDTCGIILDGSIRCWGYEASTAAPNGIVNQVTGMGNHSGAVKMGGGIQCWGPNNEYEQVAPIFNTSVY